ncbi:putative ankyrin repeat protein RF_0381 [Impatiens glandulifera]|uniref:putative ankyrin repeat protein RF_0381 n=1 Tax=Impatiens glandulifera TaxID=253017 RepID=UPI001FB0A874|nr:putative ankyrin repeat protein RF_0381 [Impatiens glandulifera]
MSRKLDISIPVPRSSHSNKRLCRDDGFVVSSAPTIHLPSGRSNQNPFKFPPSPERPVARETSGKGRGRKTCGSTNSSFMDELRWDIEKRTSKEMISVAANVISVAATFSSSDSDFNISDEEDTMKTNENNIAPHFKDMALTIKKRDVNGLQIALDNFTGDIDEYSIDGETALHYACKCYSRKSFELLVGRVANLEAKNKVGDITLHTACDIGLFNIVKFIFNNISDGDIRKRMLNSIDSDGSTPMHKEASENIKIVELLLDIIIETDNSTGISKMIQAVNTYGDTPLHEAALYGKVKIVKLLLELGASTQTRNNDGMVPYQFAKRNSEVWRILKGIH